MKNINDLFRPKSILKIFKTLEYNTWIMTFLSGKISNEHHYPIIRRVMDLGPIKEKREATPESKNNPALCPNPFNILHFVIASGFATASGSLARNCCDGSNDGG